MKHSHLLWATNLLPTVHLLEGIHFSVQRRQPVVHVWAAQRVLHMRFFLISTRVTNLS